jgi:hypothetical protein
MAIYGFVYLLSNESMPDIYKIGFTYKSPMMRAIELSSNTSTPIEFNVIMYIEIENPKHYEKVLHEIFHKNRISDNREFFKFTTLDLYDVFIEFSKVLPINKVITNDGIALHYLAEKEWNKTEQIKSLEIGYAMV